MSEQETPHPCGDWPAPCNCDDPETHDGAEQETARTVEEAALEEARTRNAVRIYPTPAVRVRDYVEGATFGATWQAARMPSVEEVAEVLTAHQRCCAWTCLCGAEVAYIGASSPVRDKAFAAHQAEQVGALWGAL